MSAPPPSPGPAPGSPPPPPGKPRRRGRWLIDVALVVAVFVGLQWWLTRDVVRGALPALEAPLIDEARRDAAQWRATDGADGFVLYVWATWCPVCKTIEGNVDAVAQDSPLLTVAMQSGAAAEVARHLAARNHRWPTLNDPDGRIARQLGVDAVPTLIFVDGQGRVRSVTQGYTTTLGIRARLWWARSRG